MNSPKTKVAFPGTGGAGGGVSGSGVSGQVSFWGGASSISGDTMFLFDSTNNRVNIGSISWDATNPETLKVDSGVTTSVNCIDGNGSINSYLQSNITNVSAGTSASSDVVATADNGNETTNFVDMGINSSGYTGGIMGAANDAYLYNVGQDLVIGAGTAAKSVIFLAGGTNKTTNRVLSLASALITASQRLVTLASVAGAAGLNVPHGTAPSSPVDGDVWTTTAGMYARINGTTVGPFGAGGGGLTWGASITGTSGSGLTLAIGASAAASTYGLSVTIDNTQTNASYGINISTGTSSISHRGINISMGDYGNALVISKTNTASASWDGIIFNGSIRGSFTGTSRGIYFDNLHSGNTGVAIGIHISGVAASSGGTASGTNGINIQTVCSSSGSASGLHILSVQSGLSSSTAIGFYIETISNTNTATTTAYGIRIDKVCNAAGPGIGISIGSLNAIATAASGKFISFNEASSGAQPARTTDTSEILHSRTNTATTGTIADNFNLVNFRRTSVQNGAGGTFTQAGSVLRLENVATQTAGTLTDSVTPLLVVQGASSTGAPIAITQNAVVSTNFRRLIRETVTGITIWMGNGNTANGALSGTAGDILLNGGSNKPEYCTGTTNWTAFV